MIHVIVIILEIIIRWTLFKAPFKLSDPLSNSIDVKQGLSEIVNELRLIKASFFIMIFCNEMKWEIERSESIFIPNPFSNVIERSEGRSIVYMIYSIHYHWV